MTLFVIFEIRPAEITYGLFILPTGKRKQQLPNNFDKFVSKAFQYRVLNFTEQTAKVYGKVMGEGKLIGHPMMCARWTNRIYRIIKWL